MPWFIVRQPNGLLARFSTVVDAFTHLDMTEEEAFEECREYLGRLDALEKVRRGVEDRDRWTDAPGDGLNRWRECLETMQAVNPDGLERFRAEYQDIFRLPIFPPPATEPRE